MSLKVLINIFERWCTEVCEDLNTRGSAMNLFYNVNEEFYMTIYIYREKNIIENNFHNIL